MSWKSWNLLQKGEFLIFRKDWSRPVNNSDFWFISTPFHLNFIIVAFWRITYKYKVWPQLQSSLSQILQATNVHRKLFWFRPQYLMISIIKFEFCANIFNCSMVYHNAYKKKGLFIKTPPPYSEMPNRSIITNQPDT